MPKRLVKSNTDRKLFGVAGGVAEYFDLDPTLVRVGFVLASFCSLFLGLVAYVVMAIVMPSAEGANAGSAPDTSDSSPTGGTSATAQATDTEDQNRRQNHLFGLVLVGIGILIAVTRFDLFSWVSWAITAAGLIVVGVVLLTRRFRET